MRDVKLSKLLSGDYGGEEDLLCCPHCKENHVRHTWVDVFNVGSQYHDNIVYSITPEDNGAKWDSELRQHRDQKGNPSMTDAHGISIGFECGCCFKYFTLKIAQHKGHTWLTLTKD